MPISLLNQNFAWSRMAAALWRVISSIFVVYSNQKNCFLCAHPKILHPNRASARDLPGRSGLKVSLKASAADCDISNILALRLRHRRLLPHFDALLKNSCNDRPPLHLLCLTNSYCKHPSQRPRFWLLPASCAVSPPCFRSHLDYCCCLDSSRRPLTGTAPRFSYVDSLFL